MKSGVFVSLAVLFIAVIASQLKFNHVIKNTNTAQQVAMCYESSGFRFVDDINLDEWLPSIPIASYEESGVMLPFENSLITDIPLIPKLSVSAQSKIQSADILAHKSWY